MRAKSTVEFLPPRTWNTEVNCPGVPMVQVSVVPHAQVNPVFCVPKVSEALEIATGVVGTKLDCSRLVCTEAMPNPRMLYPLVIVTDTSITSYSVSSRVTVPWLETVCMAGLMVKSAVSWSAEANAGDQKQEARNQKRVTGVAHQEVLHLSLSLLRRRA